MAADISSSLGGGGDYELLGYSYSNTQVQGICPFEQQLLTPCWDTGLAFTKVTTAMSDCPWPSQMWKKQNNAACLSINNCKCCVLGDSFERAPL